MHINWLNSRFFKCIKISLYLILSYKVECEKKRLQLKLHYQINVKNHVYWITYNGHVSVLLQHIGTYTKT